MSFKPYIQIQHNIFYCYTPTYSINTTKSHNINKKLENAMDKTKSHNTLNENKKNKKNNNNNKNHAQITT